MKKVITALLAVLFVSISLFPTPNIFAEVNETTPILEKKSEEPNTVTTVYELVPAFTTNSVDSDTSNAALSSGNATVTCRDGGHGIASCDYVQFIW
ncbi:hypothetical protein ACH0R4_RS10300 [Bacillus cytotoxicus]|uniref:hypothetical protein n=1 Tax=Bacillus cereus group sp. BfR-BA-01492 TaxID=2920361 RepID=UPI001F574B7D|nr:hypothetical protein [Bacillus cereus group sp. BfR-BA-01492]